MTRDLFFLSVTDALPKVNDPARAALGLQHWEEQTARLDDPELAAFARDLTEYPACRRLLEALFANSAFLTHCVLTDIGFLARLLKQGPEAVLNEVLAALGGELNFEPDKVRLMAALRVARRRVALAVALADITASWPLEQITEALSAFADAALSATLSHLLRGAAKRGDIALADAEHPERGCGYSVLAMGKYGARELNYSSDIDLIVIFDPEKADYRGRLSPQEAFVRMTRDLVAILEERTGDGYVHRVDLRLRPDPGAMPLAISYNAAMTYYESMGQNWERAAMIKARPAAGDLELGAALLAELKPFVWRKHLDFWAIEDVHSIKRQIHSHKPQGRRQDRAGRAQHQARPRRHSRDRVLRPDPATDLRRARPAAALVGDGRGAGRPGPGRPHRPGGGPGPRRGLPLPAHPRASPADGRRPADP
jgi:glutamate-ammonia-ligase adenylyltransferase